MSWPNLAELVNSEDFSNPNPQTSLTATEHTEISDKDSKYSSNNMVYDGWKHGNEN